MGKKNRIACFSFFRRGKRHSNPTPPPSYSTRNLEDLGPSGALSSSAGLVEIEKSDKNDPSSMETPVPVSLEQLDAPQEHHFPGPESQTCEVPCGENKECPVASAHTAICSGMHFSISAQSESNVLSNVMNNCSINSVNINATFGKNASPSPATTGVSLEEVRNKMKTMLKKRYECIFEGIPKRGQPSHLVSFYTELYITRGENEHVNAEHEVWHVEAAAKKENADEITVKCNDIFKPLPGQETLIKNVLTKGIAGIGKTISIQKFILDWADGNANSDITFVFPLPFRQLNHFYNKEFSLMELIQHFFPPMTDFENIEDCKVLFIFDGLDECRLTLNYSSMCWCSVKESTSVNVLLVNLIQGNLFPSALVWITSRPAAVTQIPPEYIHLMTEIRGFNDQQKDEYFMKKFSNNMKLASRVINHVRTCRSLYIMCHMPVFCWISATVLGKMLIKEDSQEIPKTLTQMYTNLLLIQTKIKNQKYDGEYVVNKNEISELDKRMIVNLGQLAFQELKKSNLIFYEEDLKECDIDAKAASLCSGMFTEIFKEEFDFYEQTVYCFVHLSVQEYLAALFVHFQYINMGENLLNPSISKGNDLYELHKSAVNMALESKNGQFDLFLRFLLGIALESNQKILPCLLGGYSSSLQYCEKTIKHIKQEIKKNPSPERAINLFHCLNELNDNTLVEEIQTYLHSGCPTDMELSPDQCSALAYVLLMSADVLEDFDLTAYNATAAGRRRLLPVLKFCRRACLRHCRLTKFLMEPVLQVLQSPCSLLTQLDLSYNKLGDNGVKLLCDSLKTSASTLQVLWLGDCTLTGSCCEDLASVLRYPLYTLKELLLNGNDIEDRGVEYLCGVLKKTSCQLQRLGLLGCRVTERGCASLASALQSNPLHLTQLDLSYNHPGESGLELLFAAQKVSSLETLIVDHCGQCRDKPGLHKYSCQLSLDPNTVNLLLYLSEDNKKVTGKSKFSYPDHPERFEDWTQVLCKEGLSGRCYWEVEWDGGGVDIAVAYKGICRKGRMNCGFGFNNQSWSLHTAGDVFNFFHNGKSSVLHPRSVGSRRVAVYLDWPAGILAFYRIDKHSVLLHQLITKFTEPLYPGFSVSMDYSLSICSLY